MPYAIHKIRNKSCFKVINTKTKRIFSRCTSKKRAQKQKRLLNAIHYNRNFTYKRSRGTVVPPATPLLR